MQIKSALALILALALWSGHVTARETPCESAFAGPIPLVAQETGYTCGVACVRSLLKFFNGYDLGEYYLAQALGTHRYGCTYTRDICSVLTRHGLDTAVDEGLTVGDLMHLLLQGEKLIVNYRPSGLPHYAVVKAVSRSEIRLMDPWVAHEGREAVMSLEEFRRVWFYQTGDGEIIPSMVIRVRKRGPL